MTQYLKNMKVGEEANVTSPFGFISYTKPGTFKFLFYNPRTYNHIGMIAGGTGITPMLQVFVIYIMHNQIKLFFIC